MRYPEYSSGRLRWFLPEDLSGRALLIDSAVSLLKRAHDARERARRAQESLLAAQARAAHAVPGPPAVQSTVTRVTELRGCLEQLNATSRSLEKAMTDVARERERLVTLLERAQRNTPHTAKRILHFRR
jgi:hypothetical protein